MSADNRLATPRPGTLGDLMARAAEDLECQVEHLTELVCEAFTMLASEDVYDPSDWFERAAPIVGEAT